MRELAASDPFAPPPGAQSAFVQDGQVFIWQPHWNVVVQKASGILSLPLAQCFADFYRPRLVPGACFRIFNEFASLTEYTREAREYLTEFTRQHLFAIDVLHFLLASKVMALGVSAYKHDIGDERVLAYSDRESFVHSYVAALSVPAPTT
jgi:hypothetical protein